MGAEFTCVRVYVYIYAHWVCKCRYVCLHVWKLSLHVFVYISTYIHTETTCVWVYIYIYVHQVYRCVYAEFTCMCVYNYIHVRQIHMRMYMFTSIRICMKRHRVCMQDVCLQIQAYMSVFVSCLLVCFICVCRYIHIYLYTRMTPWVHTDTLCAHRNTYIRICVCACVCMYTHVIIYIWQDAVCAYEFTCVCVYTCIYARRLHMCVHICFNLCKCVYICFHIYTPSLHVYVYLFTCMVAEFTCVSVYVYICAHRVCKCR